MATPATVDVMGTTGAGRIVANLNAQIRPGGPAATGKDTASAREDMFQRCLRQLQKHIHAHTSGSITVGFPWRIGCGLAKGHWPRYRDMIARWAASATTSDGQPIRVRVFKRPCDGPVRTTSDDAHDATAAATPAPRPRGTHLVAPGSRAVRSGPAPPPKLLWSPVAALQGSTFRATLAACGSHQCPGCPSDVEASALLGLASAAAIVAQTQCPWVGLAAYGIISH